MSWSGKVIGGTFGFLAGGPLGALLGAAFGHQFDQGMDDLGIDEDLSPGDQQRVQMAFFTATFSVMGHIAKADGQVSQAEIDMASKVMDELQLSADMRKTAINLFQQGKASDFPLDEVIEQFRIECHRRTNLIRMFLEIQLQAAYADGQLDISEDALLTDICSKLKVSIFEFEGLKLQFQAQQRFHGYRHQQRPYQNRPQKNELNDAFAVLGVSNSASDAEIKKAYRRLMSQHHPDKLVAKGLPEEMMVIAKEKTQQIRKAYDLVMSQRKTS